MTVCPKCGEPNPARASFCLACGTPLPSPDLTVRPARKTVGVRLHARSGVNTGEVVTGDPAIGDALVLGDAVNVAARLEQAAPPGEVLLGQPTFRLVRDAVQVEPVPPLHLKGKQAPVAAWRLLGVAPGAPGHARRQDAPIVGREPELRLFDWVSERVSATAACHLLTVLGQAGVGKTRLVAEVVRGLDATVLRGRCLSYGEGITFWPVAEVVHQAAGTIDTDSPAEATAKLRRRLGDADDADHVAGRVAQLIGLEATPVPVEEAAWAFRRLLEVLAGPGTLVVVLDDLHWAEPTLLDLVEHVADYVRAAPILLVAIARPELLEQRPGWAGGKLNATTVLLEPLGEVESAELLASLAGPAALPEGARRGITRAAEGNPLFLEELLAALVEEGRLRREDGRWVATDLAALGIPPSIQALLTARMDRLDDADRATLERASVVGQAFELSAVLELSPPDRRQDIPAGWGPSPDGSCCGRSPRGWPATRASSSATSSCATPPTTRSPSRHGPSCTSASRAGWSAPPGRGCARSRRSSATTWSGPGATGWSWAPRRSATGAWPRRRPGGSARRAAAPWPAATCRRQPTCWSARSGCWTTATRRGPS